jgi:predicted Zn-dependent protease
MLLAAQSPAYGESDANRGRLLLDLSRPRAALAQLDRALARDPASLAGWYSAAEACYMVGDRARSQAALVRARALAPSPEVSRRLDALAATLATGSAAPAR